MSLTSQQLIVLRAAIDADPALAAQPLNSDGDYNIAIALDALDTPAFIVWKTKVSRTQAMVGMDWTRVDNLSVGKARIWDWMFSVGTINVGEASIRAGIDASWVGSAADLAVRATVYANCKRSATRAERLFAAGTGSDAAPATLGFEGALDPADVQAARAL